MITEIGSTKILITRYENSDQLYESIRSKLEDIINQPNRVPFFIKDGVCSFHNVDDTGRELYKWDELADFTTFIRNKIKEYLQSISVDVQDVSIAGMWANRYPPGTFVSRHNHNQLKSQNTVIIGALYYIRMDENAGSLVIDIPEYGEYNTEMKEGDVVIFQSSLDHWTIPNNSNADKYVIGIEAVVGEKGVTLDEL